MENEKTEEELLKKHDEYLQMKIDDKKILKELNYKTKIGSVKITTDADLHDQLYGAFDEDLHSDIKKFEQIYQYCIKEASDAIKEVLKNKDLNKEYSTELKNYVESLSENKDYESNVMNISNKIDDLSRRASDQNLKNDLWTISHVLTRSGQVKRLASNNYTPKKN